MFAAKKMSSKTFFSYYGKKKMESERVGENILSLVVTEEN